MPDRIDVIKIIIEGNISDLQALVDSDESLARVRDANGISALMTAAYHGKSEIVRYLRPLVPEPDIHEAAMLGDTAALRRYLDDNSAIRSRSPDGFTPLHLASFFNQPGIVKLLLDHGADTNAVADNQSRVRALHSAAACGSIDISRMLLEHGADVNAFQQGGWTALHAAARHGNLDLVELLLGFGADPDQAADDGQTPVMMAANDTVRRRLTG